MGLDNISHRVFALSVLPQWAINITKQLYLVEILDNGSEPPLDLDIGRIFARSEVNLLFTKGWNYFMEKIDYPDLKSVWMLNDDLYDINEYVFEGLIKILFSEQKIAAVTPSFNSPHKRFKPRDPYENPQIMRESKWVDWCCPLVNMKAWREVGAFDERFTGYGADIDWCYRARQQGWKFFVSDIYKVKHVEGATRSQLRTSSAMADPTTMDKLLFDKWGKHWYELI
jgi:GT2 family glycosyltransferase